MDSERVLSSVLAEAREDSRAQNSASSAQKSGATAARVDPNQSNANASGVAAVATGMSLFYAFDKTVAAETGGAPTEGLAPAPQTAAPAADAAAPAFVGGSDAELSPVPAAALQPADAVVSALPVDAAEAGVDREVSRSGGFVASSETTDAGRPGGPAREVVVQSAQAEGEAPAAKEEPADIALETAAGPAPNLYSISALSDADTSGNAVDENAAVGSRVGITALASDADAADRVTYSLSDDAGGLFAIDAVTGEVTVAGALDFESVDHYAIEVTATSSDGSVATMTYTIAINDVNEVVVSAVSDTDAAANTVNENAAVGTSVGITAFASDADGTASVSYSLSNDAGGRFAIDPTTGEVTVAGSLDRETAASYQIEVTATSSDGSTSTQTYTIGLNDQDEFNVSPVVDTNAAANGLAENAAAGTAVGVVASASDADATTNAVTYSVDDARFAVDADGTVRVAAGASFDYETESSIGITVTATSADGSTSSQAFTLAVSDVNEAAVSAISDTNAAGNTVNENAAVGTSVGITAFATDSDGTSTVSYSLSNNAGGRFAIDPTTGEVTVAGTLDRETAASYQIEVTATSSDGSTSTQTYTIGLNDQDEFNVSPVTDTNAAANGLAENAAAGTTVGVVASASDADATTNAISYSVDDARFTVDADGTVRVAAGASFDYETESSIGSP
ncbi:cadherin repeat domain-containing protein [Devosia sp.]|jgi:hypothetical protein|uniref:cadherin repeat domain-containing protein n=1 Tax=Devosia sp. TaxID=1871048 RepID=UPI0037C148C5